MSGNDQELKEFQRKIHAVVNEGQNLEKPFFAKKVMRAVEAYEAGKSSEVHQKVYQFLRIALFMGLLLFPTLTEAII